MQVAIITRPAGFSEQKGSIFSEKLKKCLAFVEISGKVIVLQA